MDLAVPDTWIEARTRLLPVIRRSTEPAHAWAAERADPANRMIRAPFAPHLREMVVLDLPDVRMFVNRGHLDRWGVGPDEALEAARANLAHDATTGLRFQDSWGLWQLDAQDGYESSRLVLPRWLGAFASAFSGPPVAAIPVQRALLVGDGSDEGALALLLDLSLRAFREGANPLSPMLYTADADGRPVPWRPDPRHPLAGRAAFAERLLLAWEYGEQGEQLGAAVDEHVAPIALERSGDESRTISRVEHTPALIPRVDVVELDGEEHAFEALIVAGALEPTDHEPPRWCLRDRTRR